jgi:hypothetical protein
MLKLSIEDSSIGQRPAGAVDLVTNKRTATTNVLVEDGGVVVIGGLIRQNNQRQESRVPVLGSIPIIGLAFKTRSHSTEKDNLMIFLRPQIMRDAAQAAYETDLKYNYMQDQQRGSERREIPPLLPGERQPRLPPLPPAPAPGQGPQSPEDQARASAARRAAEDAAERAAEKQQQQQQMQLPQPPVPPPPAPQQPQSNSAAPAPANPAQPPKNGGQQ